MKQARLKQNLHRLGRLHRLLHKLRHGNRRGVGGRVVRLRERLRRLAQTLLRQPALKQIPGATAFVLSLSLAPQLNGQTTFGPAQENAFGIPTGQETLVPTFVDIDADGDLDIFASTYGEFVLFTNSGNATDPIFPTTPISSPFGLEVVTEDIISVGAFADLDGDGDLDFLSSEYSVFYYYENVGTAQDPQYGSPALNPFGLSSSDEAYVLPTLTDLDGDGDVDLLVGGYNATLYYENTGSNTAPQFGTPLSEPFGIDSTPTNPDDESYLFYGAGDLDNDGDTDLLQGQYYGSLRFLENTGTATAPAFAPPVEQPFGFSPIDEETFVLPTLGDIDGDGDLDLLTFQYYYGQTSYGAFLVYYENTTGDEVDVREVPADFRLEISPNPATELVQIRTTHPLASVELFDATGKLILRRAGTISQLSVEDLPQGLYQLRVVLNDGSFTTERIAVTRE